MKKPVRFNKPMMMETEKNRGAALLGRVDLFYFLVFIIIFLLLFSSFFFRARTFYERDSTLLEIPLRMHAVQLLKEGNFALWTDSHGQGQPFLANMKTAVFYPTTWLYLFLPFFVAFKIHYLIHPIIGWLGMHLLGKSYGLSRRASFLASSLFFFSGMYLSSFEFYNHLAAIAWMMWALLLARLNRPIRSSTFFFNILVWVLLILAGAPEFIIIAGILVLGQAFITSQPFKSYFFKLIITVFLAVLISSVQLIPSFEMLAKTERSSQAEIWPLELIQTANLAFPGIFGDERQPGRNDFWGGHLFNRGYPLYYSLYIGFGALFLFFLSLFSLKDRKIKLWLILGALFFLMSCGRYSPFFFIYQHLPFLSSIRYPVKFFIGSVFCLSLMAGLAVDRLERPGLPAAFKKWLIAGSALLVFGFIIFRQQIVSFLIRLLVIDSPASAEHLLNSIISGLLILVLYTICFILIDRTNRARTYLITFLLAICLIDPVYHNRYINPTVDESYFRTPLVLNEMNTPALIYRSENESFTLNQEEIPEVTIMSFYRHTLFPFTGFPYGICYTLSSDFMATYPSGQNEMIREIKSLAPEKKLKFLRYVGCQYYLGNKPLFSPEKSKRIIVEGFTQYLETISEKPARPLVVYDLMKAETAQERLDIFIDSKFDPEKTAIVSKDFMMCENNGIKDMFGAGSQGRSEAYSIDILEEKAGYGQYKINSPAAGLAIFPGNWAQGWKAWVDGKRVDIFEANLFSKGVVVPPGEHLVMLRYWPDSFILGSIISLLSLFSVIVGWAYFYAKKKRHG
ncbi:MAG: YfhO family protein [Acidobacteriota bacterium]|nr:YfhO family protein [Acidobacteriota bacterium]